MGTQPLSGIFYKKIPIKLKSFPLDLYCCQSCGFVQLIKTAKKNLMFGKFYEYRTSLSNLMINHLTRKIKYLKEKKFINKHSSVLDIGSNDGTFLNNLNCKNLYGADPTALKLRDFIRQE